MIMTLLQTLLSLFFLIFKAIKETIRSGFGESRSSSAAFQFIKIRTSDPKLRIGIDYFGYVYPNCGKLEGRS
jgi:hypothetical protein